MDDKNTKEQISASKVDAQPADASDSAQSVQKSASVAAKPLVKRIIPYVVELVLLGLLIALDQIVKEKLYVYLKDGTISRVLINNFLGLTYVENTGAGFGSFQGNTLPLSIVTLVLIAAIFAYLIFTLIVDFGSIKGGKYKKYVASHWLRIPLILITAGGIGNLIDRFVAMAGTSYYGGVRDYFEFLFIDFPVFNLADNFVTVGAIWLIIFLLVEIFREGDKERKKFAAEQAQKKLTQENSTNNSQPQTADSNPTKFDVVEVDANKIDLPTSSGDAPIDEAKAEEPNKAETPKAEEQPKSCAKRDDTMPSLQSEEDDLSDGENK